MSAPDGMMLWTDRYLADTGHLSTIEHGAYFLILMAMWRNGSTLPNNPDKLATYARLTPAKWKKIAPTLMPLFQIKNGAITQKKLQEEYQIAIQKISKKKTAGALGGIAKALKQHELDLADGNPMQRQNGANGPETETETETSIEVYSKRGSRLPKAWSPSKANIDYAFEQGLDESETHLEAEKFRNYWHARAGAGAVKMDWDATWRNWVLKAVEDRRRGRGRSGGDGRGFLGHLAELSARGPDDGN